MEKIHLHDIIEDNDIERLKSYLEKHPEIIQQNDDYILHFASAWGNTEILFYLIDIGFNLSSVDDEGFSPLHEAVWGGNIDNVKVLIENGVDINADSKQYGRTTPLEIATVNQMLSIQGSEEEFVKYSEIAKFLLQHGAKITTIPVAVQDQ